MFNIFEHPWGLVVLATVALVVIFIVRAVLPEKRRWWQLAIPVFIAAAGFGVDFFVKTDLEKINTLITTVIKAVEQEDSSRIATLISPDYHDSYHNNKKRLLNHCKRQFSEPLVKKGVGSIISVDFTPSGATVLFTVRIVFDERSEIAQSFKNFMFIKIKMQLKEQANRQWLIQRIELLEIDRRPVTWQEILTY